MFYRNVIKLPPDFTGRHLGRNPGSPDVKQDARWNELSKTQGGSSNIKEGRSFRGRKRKKKKEKRERVKGSASHPRLRGEL